MFWIWVILTFLGYVGLAVLISYGSWLSIGTTIKKQAQKPEKRFFAPAPRPGSSSFIANEGIIVGIFENVVGWKLKEINGRRLFTLGTNEPGFWERHLGVRWIGLYPTIKMFKDWEWSELQEKEVEENGKKVVRYEIKTRKADVSDFFFQFSHPVRIEAIEIKGNIQVAITMLITVLNLDPVRAQFLNKDPSIFLANIIQSTVRSCICDMTFDEVKKMVGTAITDQQAFPSDPQTPKGLWDAINELNGLEMDTNGTPLYETEKHLGVFGKLGKYIVRAEITQVDAVGEAAKAIEAKRIAELQGDAEIAEADKAGQAKVVTATKEAEAKGILQQAQADFVMATIVKPIKEGGDSVGHVLEAQVLTGPDSKLNVLVQRGSGTGTTIPIGKQ